MESQVNPIEVEEHTNLVELDHGDQVAASKDTEEQKEEKKELSMKLMEKMYLQFKILAALRHKKKDAKPILITPGLYIGSIGAALSKESLLESQISHVLICANSLKPAFPKDFVYKSLPLTDSASQDIKQYFEESIEFIDSAIKEQKNILVHCFAGISRSSTIILAYLIKYHKMRLEDGIKFMREKRKEINPNPGFSKQLLQYEKEILGEILQQVAESQEMKPESELAQPEQPKQESPKAELKEEEQKNQSEQPEQPEQTGEQLVQPEQPLQESHQAEQQKEEEQKQSEQPQQEPPQVEQVEQKQEEQTKLPEQPELSEKQQEQQSEMKQENPENPDKQE